MISPSELVRLIVSNNPSGVRRNLLQSGLVNAAYQLTPHGLMNLLTELPEQIVKTREQAVTFITQILNVPIDPQGVGGGQLTSLSQNYGLPLSGIVRKIFEENMPVSTLPQNIEQHSNCGCKNASKTTPEQAVILTLAALGLIFVITILVKLFLKILQ